LTINRLESYLRPRPRLSRRFWAIPLVLGASAIAIAGMSVRQSGRLEQLRLRNDAFVAAQAVPAAPRPRPSDLEEQKRWAEMRAERDFPWQRVFQAVERADRTNIELLEFKPDKRNRQVLLRGEARDQDALTAYLEALASQPALARVHLLHRQRFARDKLTTIGFEIKATLRQ
jgi:hypothetical protein